MKFIYLFIIAVFLIPITQSVRAQTTVGEIDQGVNNNTSQISETIDSNVDNATAIEQAVSNANISGVYSVKGPLGSNSENLQVAVSTARCDAGDIATGGGSFVKGINTNVAATASEAVGT